MSRMVREWLRILGKLSETTHEDRGAIDREIEWTTGIDCDEAIERGLLTLEEFEDLVKRVLKAMREKRMFKEQVEKLFEKKKQKKKPRKKKKERKTVCVASAR